MALFQATIAALERRFPLSLASSTWDNVGIMLESVFERPQADRVLLTIDLTPAVLHEAVADPRVGAIVAYHPPIFRGLKRLTRADPKQNILLTCAAKGISVYSPHTAWDNNAIGNADWLATCLGVELTQSMTIDRTESALVGQEEAGTGRLVTLEIPQKLSTLVANIKHNLGLDHVRAARASKHWTNGQDDEPISSVAICAGSGGSVLVKAKADLFLTGEMSHHEVLAAVEQNTSVILCEHSNTERRYLGQIIEPYLREEFAKSGLPFDVKCSQADRDPLEYV
ncbi:hypothetical protein H4R33_002331 [Dimargaris cristalligena]|nr:hypothetical protein H4R33_002331 [Dimargaris cristalligena]